MQPERSLSYAFIPQGTGGTEHVFPCQRASWGIGFPGLSSQASVMEKIYHFEQGRARLTESVWQSRASSAPGTEQGANLQRAAQQLSTSINL